jgi:hypothetical protein
MPLTMPFTDRFPKDPALKTAGGMFASGPVMDGVLRAVGAAGAAAAACVESDAGGAAGVCANTDRVAVNRQVRESRVLDICEITPLFVFC